MPGLIEISPDKFVQSPFHLIGRTWQLIAVEKGGEINAMTASWGGMGVLWNLNVSYIVVRPQRYTKGLIDGSESFSVSFFDDCHKDMLEYMGTNSGRDADKVAEAGLTVRHEGKTPYFEEATAVMICRKLYAQKLAEDCFIDKTLAEKWYPEKDFHTMYIGAIEKILMKGE